MALSGELLLQALWRGWRRKSREIENHFDRVVDEPLEGSERTNHDDTRHEAFPEAGESDSTRSLASCEAFLIVQLRHYRISYSIKKQPINQPYFSCII